MSDQQTSFEVLRDAIEHLRNGWVEQAHVDLMVALEHTAKDTPLFDTLAKSANWIHPLNNPVEALKVLQDYLED